MLALAAKAMHELRDPNFMNYDVLDDTVCLELGSRRGAITAYWNPLTDDGDALRLAVALRIDISFNEEGGCVYAEQAMASVRRHKGDATAATRYAITRAAAEIGASHAEAA